MNKIAFFVEGKTERIFVEKLLSEYIGFQNIELEVLKYLGSKGSNFITKRINPYCQYFILIFDVGGDGSVTSAIRERAESMINNSGYTCLIAFLDLFPRHRNEKTAVIDAFYKIFDGYLFVNKIKFALAIMEIEAWFLADFNVFNRIDPSITPLLIKENLGYDLENDSPESYEHPSRVLDHIYSLFGRRYRKREEDLYFIIYRLDYNHPTFRTSKIWIFELFRR